MPILEKKLAVQNGAVFVSDPTHRDVTLPPVEKPVTASSSCICIATKHEVDGDTTIRLASRFDQPSGSMIFDGNLETPGQRVEISGVGLESLLEMAVPDRTTRITVWTNHPDWPDLILVQAQAPLVAL